MTSTNNTGGRLACGAGGALLIVALFLPWADAGSAFGGSIDADVSGWELLAMADVLLLLVGLAAIGSALTGGQFGLFRPDLSLAGAADLLGVVGSVVVAWFLIFDFPDGASREIGAFLALAGAMAVAGGAGDYSTLRGAPLFPRTAAAGDVTPAREP